MDIMAEDSLCGYVFQPMVNLVTMLLIILGGLGYIVWWDVLRVLKNIRSQKLKCFRLLTLHSKIALTVTGILIVVGAAAFYIFEYNNPLTMQDYTVPATDLGIPVPGSNYANRRFCHDSTRGSDQYLCDHFGAFDADRRLSGGNRRRNEDSYDRSAAGIYVCHHR